MSTLGGRRIPLAEDARAILRGLASDGVTYHRASVRTGINWTTCRKYMMAVARPPCPCGRPAGHKGSCQHRKATMPRVAEFLSTWRKVWTAEMDATLHEGWVAGILPALIADKINLTFSRSDITASKVQSRAAFLHLYRPSDFRGVLRRTGIAGRKRGTLNKATVARLALANPTKEIVIAPTVPAEFQNEMLSLMPRLRNFAMSLCRNSSRADDLVQDTIARAWANAESFQAGSNMIAWLMTILRNLYYGDFRKSGREVEDVDDVHAMAVKVAPAQESRMEFLDLKAAMAKLSPEHRQALLMIGVSSMSYEDMAEKVGVPVGTMKSRVSRARADLADILGYRP